MAEIATALPFITRVSSFSSSSPTPSPLRSLHRRPGPGLNPRLRICHVKLRGSREGVTDRINEEYFDGGREFVMEDDVDDDGEEDEDEDEEDKTESSLDLLVKFVQSLFKKVSKRARKASRSVLPDAISPQLLSFAVDGVLVLASLSIMKALLEVVCTLGGTIFVAILLLRLIWAAIAFFQLNGNDFNQSENPHNRTQPVS